MIQKLDQRMHMQQNLLWLQIDQHSSSLLRLCSIPLSLVPLAFSLPSLSSRPSSFSFLSLSLSSSSSSSFLFLFFFFFFFFLFVETHGGQDVPVYCVGPRSYVVHGVMEENVLFFVFTNALDLFERSKASSKAVNVPLVAGVAGGAAVVLLLLVVAWAVAATRRKRQRTAQHERHPLLRTQDKASSSV